MQGKCKKTKVNMKKGVFLGPQAGYAIIPDITIKEDKMSIEKLFKEIEEKEKKHPIKTKIRRVYYLVVNFIEGVPRYIKEFIQRGKRGWASSDVWGLHYYLAKIISETVAHLKEEDHGLPTWKEGKTEKQALKEWNNILNAIIKTFKTAQEIGEGDLIYLPSKDFSWNDYKKWKNVCEKLNKKYKGKDRVMTKRESIEFEKGFDLFREWFFALWD